MRSNDEKNLLRRGGIMISAEEYREIDLTNQVAIVTGGGRGIGRAIAIALAKAGATVAAAARTETKVAETVDLIESDNGHAVAFPVDVTDTQAVGEMVDEIEHQIGPIDLLVNNAGITAKVAPIWKVDPDQWRRCIDVNLCGSFLCTRAVLQRMVTRRSGRIISTASNAGLGAWKYVSAYSISKCAVMRLTECIVADANEYGICAFAIHPGLVRTEMTESESASIEDENWLAGVIRTAVAEGRDIPPERAAELVVFLASGRADVLSGCYISVGGDIVEMVSRAEEIKENELYKLRLHTLA